MRLCGTRLWKAGSKRQIDDQSTKFRWFRTFGQDGQVFNGAANGQIVGDGDYPRHGQSRLDPFVGMFGDRSQIMGGQDTVFARGEIEHRGIVGAPETRRHGNQLPVQVRE